MDASGRGAPRTLPTSSAAIVNVHQLQQSGDWENRIRAAFELFEKDGNEFVEAEDLVKVRALPDLPSKGVPFW